MRWLVGIDSRSLSAGATSLARWCSARAAAQAFIGVHVVEQPATALAAELEPPMEAATLHQMADVALDPLRAESVFSELAVIEARTIEEGLESAAEDRRCDAIMLGRRKPAAHDTVLRLGRVARRMLRRLPRPVVVVPPDLRGQMLPRGPVLVATDLGPASKGAAELARRLAQELDLELLVGHVLRPPDSVEALLPADAWDDRMRARESQSRAKLGEWMAAHDMADARYTVVLGSPTDRLLEVARVASASMMIVGSRGLQTLERFFQSSVGSELAASAPIPVAVVPPNWTAQGLP